MKRFVVLLPLLALALGVSGQRIVRENIEWLDVWMPHVNERAELPRVLLVGNSITRAYNREVDKLLDGRAYVARMATSKSIGDPALLRELEMVLSYHDFDVVHFNNGLHGAGYTEEEYAAAFPDFYNTIRNHAPNAILIWATTTPVRFENRRHDYVERTARVVERNRIAAEFLKDKDVVVNDLYSFADAREEFYTGGDGIHLVPKGVTAMAVRVAEVISAQLDKLTKKQ